MFLEAICTAALASGLLFGTAGAAPGGRGAAFLSAIDSGDAASVKALIPGSDLARRFDAGKGDTPLTAAARKGHAEIVRMLLDAGAPIEGRNKSGGTALLIAAQGGRTEAVKLLVSRGADLETTWQGRTPLLQAARWGHADVIRVLLDAGADRNARSEGMDAVGFAKKYGQKDALAALGGKGAADGGAAASGGAIDYSGDCFTFFEEDDEMGESLYLSLAVKGDRAYFLYDGPDGTAGAVYAVTNASGRGFTGRFIRHMYPDYVGGYFEKTIAVRSSGKGIAVKNGDYTSKLKRDRKELQKTIDEVTLKNK